MVYLERLGKNLIGKVFVNTERSKPGVKELYLPDKNYKWMYYTWGPLSQKD